jgi:heme exporter protein D|tara:strand:+ start:3019 stop:3183 length:165 start_codon:yes stop_codon:yes gene_type:complete
MSEIFAMDGYGFYVWGSVLISIAVLIINWMTANKLFKSNINEVKLFLNKIEDKD